MGSDYYLNPPQDPAKSLSELVANLEEENERLIKENEKLRKTIMNQSETFCIFPKSEFEKFLNVVASLFNGCRDEGLPEANDTYRETLVSMGINKDSLF